MPARVLHILGTAQPEGAAIGGIIELLAAGVDRRRYELSACFVGAPGPWQRRLSAAGVVADRVPWPHPADPWGALRFWRYLRARKFDLLHIHYGGRSLRRLARAASGAKVLVHLHGRVTERGDLQPLSIPVGDADAVLATSQAVARAAHGKPATVVYPAVLPAAGSGVVSPDQLIIGAAGRLIPLKGFPVLLEAFAALGPQFPQVRMEIAGEGPQRSALEAQTRFLGIAGAVRFLGWQEDLSTTLSRWSLFVQPSLEEAFGMTALQAMAAGLPVVATRAGGLPELAQDGRDAVLVSPGDAASLAGAIAGLLRDPQRREVLGRAARCRAAQFSPQRLVRDVVAVYDALLATPGCSAPQVPC